MYANPPNVHQGHNQQHYLPHIHSNGHANHPAPQMHPQHSPAQPPPPQRPAPAASIPKSPINVVGIPSVHIENNQLVVGSSQSSQCSPSISCGPPAYISQVRHDPTPPSRCWATVHLEQSGCVIGMGPYPPIHLSHPCNAAQGPDQSGQGSAW